MSSYNIFSRGDYDHMITDDTEGAAIHSDPLRFQIFWHRPKTQLDWV